MTGSHSSAAKHCLVYRDDDDDDDDDDDARGAGVSSTAVSALKDRH